MAVDFGSLAVQAFSGPGGFLFAKFGPDVPRGKEGACRSHTWVVSSMEVLKNLSADAEFQRDQGF